MLFRWSSYCPLDHVPNELWDKIFDLMHTCDLSLLSVHRTCRRFCELTKPYIYRHVKFARTPRRPPTFFTSLAWDAEPSHYAVHCHRAAERKALSVGSSTGTLVYRQSVSWIECAVIGVQLSLCVENMPNLTCLTCVGIDLGRIINLLEVAPKLRRLQLSSCLPNAYRADSGTLANPQLALRELEIDELTDWAETSEQTRRFILDHLALPSLESLCISTLSRNDFFHLVQDMKQALSSHRVPLFSLSLRGGYLNEREHLLINTLLQSQPTLRSFSLSFDGLRHTEELPHGTLPELRFLKISANDYYSTLDGPPEHLARTLIGTRTFDGDDLSQIRHVLEELKAQSSLLNLSYAARAKSFEFSMSPSFSFVTELVIRTRSRQLHKDFMPSRLADHIRTFSSLRILRFLPPEESPRDTESVRISLLWLRDAVNAVGRACPSLRNVELGNGVQWVRVDKGEWAGYKPWVGNKRRAPDAEEKLSFRLMGLLAPSGRA